MTDPRDNENIEDDDTSPAEPEPAPAEPKDDEVTGEPGEGEDHG